MKKLVLGLLLTASLHSFAQTTYEKAMNDKIAKIEQVRSADELTALSNDFTRIADKEKTQWLPYYYSAYATLQRGRAMMQQGKTADLDAVTDAADAQIAKAEALSPNNAELFILKKMSHGLRMMVNPQARFMTEGTAATEALTNAEKLSPNNPRITLLKAEDMYFTPPQFGGDKAKGLELFKKSLDQFDSFKPATAMDPNWGRAEAEYFLANKP
ncbi:MAG: hypothetical protein EAS48_08060 [Chryseobacterium sp.]|nr:MAG: hypothetical protein EAS48_08060 [Chryseobacterium sp.]